MKEQPEVYPAEEIDYTPFSERPSYTAMWCPKCGCSTKHRRERDGDPSLACTEPHQEEFLFDGPDPNKGWPEDPTTCAKKGCAGRRRVGSGNCKAHTPPFVRHNDPEPDGIYDPHAVQSNCRCHPPEHSQDPNVKPPSAAELASQLGAKLDTGKLQWSLLPLGPVREIVKVLQHGVQKYQRDNWQHVPDARRRYYEAALRHLTDWWEGSTKDPETGLHPLAHAGCCLLFLMWFDQEGEVDEGSAYLMEEHRDTRRELERDEILTVEERAKIIELMDRNRDIRLGKERTKTRSE